MNASAVGRGSAALTPRGADGDPLRPILVSGEGLAPDERERRRLELRRECSGRLLVLDRDLSDALNPDSFVALDPGFPWLEWSAALNLTHPALRRPRYAYIFEDGLTIYAYSVDFLIRLRWVVELLRPLMVQECIEVAAFYETGWMRLGGARELPAVFGDAVVPQVISLSRHCGNDADLAYCAAHELAHCGQPLADRDDPTTHGAEFRARFGRYLHWLLNGPGTPQLSDREDRWLRSYAIEDSYAPPIHPGPERGWQFDRDGRWIMCPHPTNDPPDWALEDW